MKAHKSIRTLAIAIILFFGLGALGAIAAIFTGRAETYIVLAAAFNLAFVVSGVGLLMLRRWSWWLTVILSGISVAYLLWSILAPVAFETSTKHNDMLSYVVAGFYLAIASFLMRTSVRKAFPDAWY